MQINSEGHVYRGPSDGYMCDLKLRPVMPTNAQLCGQHDNGDPIYRITSHRLAHHYWSRGYTWTLMYAPGYGGAWEMIR